jgi:hypothetical protein
MLFVTARQNLFSTEDHHFACPGQLDVGRLQVTVNDAFLVDFQRASAICVAIISTSSMPSYYFWICRCEIGNLLKLKPREVDPETKRGEGQQLEVAVRCVSDLTGEVLTGIPGDAGFEWNSIFVMSLPARSDKSSH